MKLFSNGHNNNNNNNNIKNKPVYSVPKSQFSEKNILEIVNI